MHYKKAYLATSAVCMCLLLASCTQTGEQASTPANLVYEQPERGSIAKEQATAIAIASGLSGQQGLPQDVRQQLVVGKTLPSGAESYALPQFMRTQLPTFTGHQWVQVGRDLVLVASATQTVVDIIEEVFQ